MQSDVLVLLIEEIIENFNTHGLSKQPILQHLLWLCVSYIHVFIPKNKLLIFFQGVHGCKTLTLL